MSKGPKKKPARKKASVKAVKADKAEANKAVKAEAKSKVKSEAAPQSAPQSALQDEKKSGGGSAAIAVIVFLAVLGAGAYINWIFWSETVVPAKTETKAGKVASKPVPKPESPKPAKPLKPLKPTSEKVAAAAEKTAPETAPEEAPGVEKLAAERRQLRQALERLMDRMEGIEKSLERVRKLAQATQPPKESGDKIKALMQRMDRMEKDSAALVAVPAGVAPPTPNVPPIPNTPGAETAPVTTDAGAVMLAVGNLRRAVAKDGPYEKELAALKKLAGANPDINAAVVLLSKNASVGILTLTGLGDRFGKIAGAIVRASKDVGKKDWFGRVANRLSKLVSWRRIDGKGGSASVDTAVAAAERHLKAGDLKAAIDAIEGLSANAAAVAAPWLGQAKARMTAERALTSLHLHALTLLAPVKLEKG